MKQIEYPGAEPQGMLSINGRHFVPPIDSLVKNGQV